MALALLATLSAWPTGDRPPTGAAQPVEANETVVLEYDEVEGRFAPFLQGIAAEGMSFSRDGTRVAYVSHPQGELWRSRRDGTEARRLTEAPMQAALPRWSPDGRKIVFSGRTPDGPWRIRIVPAGGGRVETVPVDGATDAGWTSDGRYLVFGADLEGTPALFRWDLAARRQGLLPGSIGFFSPRLSPDGRYLAALRSEGMELMVRDGAEGEWMQLTRTPAAYPSWSPDGRWLHFRDDEDRGFYRIEPSTGLRERVADIGDLAMASGPFGAWSGVTPEGVPLLLHDLRGSEYPERMAKAMAGFQDLIDPAGPYASSTADWSVETPRGTSRTGPRPLPPGPSAH